MNEQIKQLVTLDEFSAKVKAMCLSLDGFNLGIVKFVGCVECRSSILGDCDDGFSFVPMIIIGNQEELHLQMLDIIRNCVNESEWYDVIETEAAQDAMDITVNNIYVNPMD